MKSKKALTRAVFRISGIASRRQSRDSAGIGPEHPDQVRLGIPEGSRQRRNADTGLHRQQQPEHADAAGHDVHGRCHLEQPLARSMARWLDGLPWALRTPPAGAPQVHRWMRAGHAAPHSPCSHRRATASRRPCARPSPHRRCRLSAARRRPPPVRRSTNLSLITNIGCALVQRHTGGYRLTDFGTEVLQAAGGRGRRRRLRTGAGRFQAQRRRRDPSDLPRASGRPADAVRSAGPLPRAATGLSDEGWTTPKAATRQGGPRGVLQASAETAPEQGARRVRAVRRRRVARPPRGLLVESGLDQIVPHAVSDSYARALYGARSCSTMSSEGRTTNSRGPSGSNNSARC